MEGRPRLIRYGGVVAGQEEIDAVTGVLRGQEWAQGKVTAEFEQAAAAVQGCGHALFVNSGSSALLLALAALPAGCAVAMPAVQFPTLYSAAVWCRLRPVLVDTDDSLNMSPAALKDAISANRDLSACAFVHMAGNPAGVTEVAGICGEAGLLLVEDVCEALGAGHGGTLAGNFGKIAATSTHAAHQISTGGGGLVFTSDGEAYARMRRVRDWGRAYGTAHLGGYYPGYVFAEPGLNLQASDIQAAIGLVQLGRLPGLVAARQDNYRVLAELTAGLPFARPRVDAGSAPSWYTFPLLCASRPERDALVAHLEAAGIESRPVVAGNMARQPMAAHGEDPDGFPHADGVFRRGLWVSVHPRLSAAELEHIAGTLRSFWER